MSAVQTACPALNMLHGCKLVTGAATQLTTQTPPKNTLFRGVLISNQSGVNIAVGGADVVFPTGTDDEDTGGMIIPSGQAFPIPCDDPTALYLIAADGSNLISWLGI